MIDIDGVLMYVSATASNGIADALTLLRFHQRGSRVWAMYSGGRIERGWLVGRRNGDQLSFRYAQSRAEQSIHAGRSRCEVLRREDGRVRIIEHFEWSTRAGHGVNIFDEIEE